MLAGNAKLSGHTGGNLLLSMMEQYSGDFFVAVDALRTLLGCEAAWPVTVDSATICAEYQDDRSRAAKSKSTPRRSRGVSCAACGSSRCP